MTCPVCNVEFSTPYAKEAQAQDKPIWCPKGHALDFIPPVALIPIEDQIEELERMFAQ